MGNSAGLKTWRESLTKTEVRFSNFPPGQDCASVFASFTQTSRNFRTAHGKQIVVARFNVGIICGVKGWPHSAQKWSAHPAFASTA